MDDFDMVDFRCKITERTAQVLEALKRSSDKDQAAIARQVLDEWAESRIHESTLVLRLTKREGTNVAQLPLGAA